MKDITREDPTELLYRVEKEVMQQATRQTSVTYQLLLDLKLYIMHTEAVLDEIQRIGGKHAC